MAGGTGTGGTENKCPYWEEDKRYDHTFTYAGLAVFCDMKRCPFNDKGDHIIDGEGPSVGICIKKGMLNSDEVSRVENLRNNPEVKDVSSKLS